jgi:hypothetical protein
MNLRVLMLPAALGCLLLLPAAQAGGKAGEKPSVSFHMQMDATDNPKMIFPQVMDGETRYFSRSPDISVKDIAAFSPFPSEDGQSYGVAFQLKPPAARRLSALTGINRGRWMVSQVSGRVVDGVMIDQQVNDGFIIIWKGVTLAEIELYDKLAPRIGAAKKKK